MYDRNNVYFKSIVCRLQKKRKQNRMCSCQGSNVNLENRKIPILSDRQNRGGSEHGWQFCQTCDRPRPPQAFYKKRLDKT